MVIVKASLSQGTVTLHMTLKSKDEGCQGKQKPCLKSLLPFNFIHKCSERLEDLRKQLCSGNVGLIDTNKRITIFLELSERVIIQERPCDL